MIKISDDDSTFWQNVANLGVFNFLTKNHIIMSDTISKTIWCAFSTEKGFTATKKIAQAMTSSLKLPF